MSSQIHVSKKTCEPSLLVSLLVPEKIYFKSQPQSISFHSFECSYKHLWLIFLGKRIKKSSATDSNWVGPVLWILWVENICEMCWIMLQFCGKTTLCFMNKKAFWENIKTFHSMRLAGLLWKEFGWIRTSRSSWLFIVLSNFYLPVKPGFAEFQTFAKVKSAEKLHPTNNPDNRKHFVNLIRYQRILQRRGVLNI